MQVVYRYRTRKCRNGFAASVSREENGVRAFNSSYQDGFRSRHKAYRYAVSMARAQASTHNWPVKSDRMQ